MDLSAAQQLDLCLRLTLAAILSAMVGIDRERHDHPAGLRTHILVGIGAALFTVLSIYGFPSGDRERVASQVVVGIGFLGAGAIVQSKSKLNIKGMTTAAGIWAVAAVGMACGTGTYILAVFSAILIWFVLSIVGRIEKKANLGDDSPGPAGRDPEVASSESDTQAPVENKPWSRQKHENS
jgi:putative Mg2+ transporter-C (MgtC) family protein